jgi:hypothetical protein
VARHDPVAWHGPVVIGPGPARPDAQAVLGRTQARGTARHGPIKILFIFFCFDFRKINYQTKNFKKYTYDVVPHGAGVPAAMGHDVRGGANGRLTCEVGLDSCRRGARRQES